MKKILLFLLLIVSIYSFGQTPPGYQTRIVRERIQGSFMVDSGLHVPRYNGTPVGVRGGVSIQDGAIALDTLNHRFYIYSNSTWSRLANYAEISGFISGTIADDQVAVGSAANTIEGTSSLTFNGSTFNVGNNPSLLYTGTGSDITSAGYASGAWWISSIRNSQAYIIQPSAGYLASVKYNSAGDYANLGGIAWTKENATDGQYGSEAIIYTIPNGGALTPGITVNSDQEVLFGIPDAGDIKFQISPKTASEFGMLIRLQPAATADAWQVQKSTFDVMGFLSAEGLLYGVTGAYGTSTTPSTKAILDLGSTTKGFLPPRMTATQRTAITSVPASLFVWDTDSSRYMGYTGSAWKGL